MFKLSAIFFLMSASVASAAECRSVGGHINGEPTKATRTVRLEGSRLLLSGVMDGNTMPRRSLSCAPLAAGIWCEGKFGPVGIVVMTNGKQMTETVTTLDTGQEAAGFAYVCDRAFRL